MILQLNPPLPLFSIPHQEEGYAYFVIEYTQENYLYFVVALDSTGEIWTLDNTQVRFCKNYTLQRDQINKNPLSQYLTPTGITPITPKK